MLKTEMGSGRFIVPRLFSPCPSLGITPLGEREAAFWHAVCFRMTYAKVIRRILGKEGWTLGSVFVGLGFEDCRQHFVGEADLHYHIPSFAGP